MFSISTYHVDVHVHMYTYTCVHLGAGTWNNCLLYLKGRRGEREEERERKGGERGGKGRQLGGEIERGGKVGERDELLSQSYNTNIRSSSRTQIACVGVSVCVALLAVGTTHCSFS